MVRPEGSILDAYFTGRSIALSGDLYQYDYGQILRFNNVDLPEHFEVHFSNHESVGTSSTAMGTNAQVAIPDKYLLTGLPIYFWVYLHDAPTDGETEYNATITVIARPKPEDYIQPVERDFIAQAIDALNVSVVEANEAAENAEKSAVKAEESAANAEESATNVQHYAELAEQSAQSASQYAQSAGESAETAEQHKTSASRSAEDASSSASSAAESASHADLVSGQIDQKASDTLQDISEAKTDAISNVDSAKSSALSEIFSAQSSAVKAVGDKGKEVLDSIPADYSDLTEDVTSLKSALGTLSESAIDSIGLPSLDWEKGILSITTGQYVASQITIYTPGYYPISANADMVFTGVTENRQKYAYFYDADKTFIIPRVAQFTIPQNARYVRFVYGFTTASGITVDSYGGVDAVAADWNIDFSTPIQTEISEAKTDIANVSDLVEAATGNAVIDWVNGAYIDTSNATVDLTPVSANAWRYAVVDCAPGNIYTLNARGGASPRTWAFIDNDNSVLSVAPANAALIDTTITAPDNATKLILNDTDKTANSFFGIILSSRVKEIEKTATDLLNGNISPNGTARTLISNGVTYVYDGNGTITANGSATSQSRFLWYNNTTGMPSGFYTGKDYYVDYWSEDMYVTIDISVYNSEGTSAIIKSIRYPQKITIPVDAVGLAFRITVGANHSVNKTIIPKIYSCESLEFARLKRAKNAVPMLTIIYDDGLNEFNEYVMPIVQSKNVPIATAVVPESIGVNPVLMDWDTIKSCYENGAEVLTHFTAFNEETWTSFGTQQISARYYKCINAIRSHGIYTPNALVFSGGSSRYPVSRAAAHRVFAAGFNASNGGINYYGEFDPWFINRYGSDNQALETMKGWVDDLVSAKTGWMVWTRHNSNATSEDPATAAQVLSDAIDYALSLGVQIVTVERGLSEYLDI